MLKLRFSFVQISFRRLWIILSFQLFWIGDVGEITVDPMTRSYLEQDDFCSMMKDIQKDPNNLNLYPKDQRMMQALVVLLNMKFRGPGGSDDVEMQEEGSPRRPEPGKEEAKKPVQEPEPEPIKLPEEEKEAMRRQRRKPDLRVTCVCLIDQFACIVTSVCVKLVQRI